MKYRQLTKEQFESLHKEFAQFLATQSIDVKEWNQIKKEKPKVADQEMNIFSDIVWEDVLNKTKYLEHFSEKNINLFRSEEKEIQRIAIKLNNDKNFLIQQDFDWFLKNIFHDSVEIFTGTKAYNSDRNLEIFDLIEKGAIISKGNLYEQLNQLIK